MSAARPRALVLYGGWPGHEPRRVADSAIRTFLGDFEVSCSDDLGLLREDVLSDTDLLVPIWTRGELAQAAEDALLEAAARGLGVLAWHGAAGAFLTSRGYKLLLGGQFVAHPGGDGVSYDVRFHHAEARNHDALSEGLEDFSLTSEQYYLLVDPAVSVVASTLIRGGDQPWLAGVSMPVAWQRHWGEGRVFYCSLGHSIEVLEHPTVTTLLTRAAHWATRRRAEGTPRSARE